jgi:hypothetical protein
MTMMHRLASAVLASDNVPHYAGTVGGSALPIQESAPNDDADDARLAAKQHAT